MALSDEARNRIFIAHTDRAIGTEIADAIDYTETVRDTVALHHDVVGAGAFATRGPGQQAVPVAYGSTLGFIYTLGVHEGYRMYKLLPEFVDQAQLHIHWTKSASVNESGRAVKWRLSYTIVNGDDVSVAPSVYELEDTYDDAGTTTRIVHRTANTPALVGALASHYVSVKVEAVAPDGTPLLNAPVLISVDLTYNRYINK